MVAIDRMALGALPGTLGNSTFFQNTSRHLLLGDFLEFGRHFGATGVQNGCQNWCFFCCKMNSFAKWVPKVAKVGPKRGPDPQNHPKMVPQGPKMGAPRPQKLRLLGLQSSIKLKFSVVFFPLGTVRCARYTCCFLALRQSHSATNCTKSDARHGGGVARRAVGINTSRDR